MHSIMWTQLLSNHEVRGFWFYFLWCTVLLIFIRHVQNHVVKFYGSIICDAQAKFCFVTHFETWIRGFWFYCWCWTDNDSVLLDTLSYFLETMKSWAACSIICHKPVNVSCLHQPPLWSQELLAHVVCKYYVL